MDLTIDELAAATGTTTRRIRSFQTLGVLPHPELQGRTGRYGPHHLARVRAILRLQDSGFSLESLTVLFGALDRGRSLADVLGLPEPVAPERGRPETEYDAEADMAERYGFAELQPRGGRRPLLSIVPTTMWDRSEAS